MENFFYESALMYYTFAVCFHRGEGLRVTEFQIRRSLQFFVNILNQGTVNRNNNVYSFCFSKKTLIAEKKLNNINAFLYLSLFHQLFSCLC